MRGVTVNSSANGRFSAPGTHRPTRPSCPEPRMPGSIFRISCNARAGVLVNSARQRCVVRIVLWGGHHRPVAMRFVHPSGAVRSRPLGASKGLLSACWPASRSRHSEHGARACRRPPTVGVAVWAMLGACSAPPTCVRKPGDPTWMPSGRAYGAVDNVKRHIPKPWRWPTFA